AEEPAEEPAENEDVAEAGTEAEGDVDTEAAEATSAVSYGGDIAVGLESEAVGLRPWEDTCSSPCYNIIGTIYDKLMEKDSNGQLQPWLAESISSNEDFTVWTMTLRPGVTFHNGVELTAQTIADMFPVQQGGTVSAGVVGASNLVGVEATGDLEVTYTLGASNSAFPAYLERAALGMVFDPAAAVADPDSYSTAPIGTGPFVIDSRDLDNETKVVRNENYWNSDAEGNQLPYLDSIAFRPIPDEGTRLDAVLSGTVDAMQSLRQGTIRDARADGSLSLYEFQGNNVGGGMFNVLKAPFDDVRVRKGLTHLNSQENVIEALGGTGISLPGSQWFSPDSVWYSEKVAAAWPQFDFEGGVALVSEYVNDPERSDGKAVGEKIDVELSCPPDPTLIAAMQVIEQVWSQTELVNVTLTQFDQQTHINKAVTDEHNAHCWRFSDDNDPATYTSAFAPPTPEIAAENGLDGIVSPVNFPNYFSAANFGAAVGAVATDDFDERFAAYESIMLDFAENVPLWYSGHTATMIAADPKLDGILGWHLPQGGDLGIGQQAAEGRWLEVFITS
ncbi:MAG: ABC transporter substrate-binding protein, partial [Ilumatobacter sp.]|nr:ABC transporter substrate-binding protein [Ilumatobacter sp.]